MQTIYSQVPNHSWARGWPSSLHAEILNDLSLLAFCVCCHVLWVHTCSFSGVFRRTCFCVIIRHLTVSPPSVPYWFPSLGRRNGILWACVRLSIVFYSLHLDQLWTFVNCCLIHKEASLRLVCDKSWWVILTLLHGKIKRIDSPLGPLISPASESWSFYTFCIYITVLGCALFHFLYICISVLHRFIIFKCSQSTKEFIKRTFIGITVWFVLSPSFERFLERFLERFPSQRTSTIHCVPLFFPF